MHPRPRSALIAISFLAFVSLGLPDGILGVAWPSIRASFRLPLNQLGVLLAASMVGYLVSSFTSGPVVARVGVGRLLLVSSVLVVLSLGGYAAAPVWGVMLACGVLAGLGAGAIDAGINAYAAAHFAPRLVNWLHACYGVGATLGPLVMTAVLTAGLAWRWGYGLIGAIVAAMAVGFLVTLDWWEDREGAAHPATEVPADMRSEPAVAMTATLRRPRAWAGVALFFIYVGLEVTAGQWSYSLFTESRGVRPGVAGVWVGVYWGCLTLGRVIFGAAAGRFPAEWLLRSGMAGAPLAAGLVWWNAAGVTGFLGLALLGFSLAPIFPLMISLTPVRLGRAHAAHAIGFQVSAGYLGAAALPGLAGILARRLGLEVIGPFLFAAALALLAIHEVTLGRIRARGAAPARLSTATAPAGRSAAEPRA
jgi:fucose permease